MIQRNVMHLERGKPTARLLSSVLREHLDNRERLERLGEAYRGRGAINGRVRSPGLPNNRIAHPFARYIVAVTTGYLIGQPVSYASADERNRGALEQLLSTYIAQSIAAVDAENARNAAIYGRGVEYVHVDETGEPHVSALSPLDAFVVYEDSYDMRALFGVYFAPERNDIGAQTGWRLWVMTADSVTVYRTDSLISGIYEETGFGCHFFGGVPLVEYWNDESERGDFEWVLPLIDAYDALQSDRVNDKEQFVNALLVLTGCTLETDERGRSPWRQLREDKALCLPDSQSKVEYLAREMNEADVEVLRRALAGDIHKLSMVPDLSDESFAANASGVAMRYKLWGLEQLVGVKQRWFIEGLRARLRLFARYQELRGALPLDISKVKITLSRAMPTNLLEQAQIAKMVNDANAASTETRVRILHAGDEWDEPALRAEARQIEAEKSDSDVRTRFDIYPDQ